MHKKERKIIKQEEVLEINLLEGVDNKEKKLSQMVEGWGEKEKNDCMCILGEIRWYHHRAQKNH